MVGITGRLLFCVSLSVLLVSPGAGFAAQSASGDHLGNNARVLEIRYCQCRASVGSSVEVAPSFLRQAKSLRVAVASADEGFVAPGAFSFGYGISPVKGEAGIYRLKYAASYAPGDEESSGEGKVELVEGQWTYLFGSRHEVGAEVRHTGVAVRLERGQSQ